MQAIGRLMAAAMRMDDAAWARHASPWSVWTRVATFPFLMAAIWSVHDLGWWSAIPIGLVVLWTWLNPRLFPPPRSTDNWASKATFGERVWLNRSAVAIPSHHQTAATILSVGAGLGAFLALWAAIAGAFWPMIAAGLLSWISKLWFCDRMVWLYEDMIDASPDYRAWLK